MSLSVVLKLDHRSVAVHGAESVLSPSLSMVLNKKHACGLFSLLGKILENDYYCLIIQNCRYFELFCHFVPIPAIKCIKVLILLPRFTTILNLTEKEIKKTQIVLYISCNFIEFLCFSLLFPFFVTFFFTAFKLSSGLVFFSLGI